MQIEYYLYGKKLHLPLLGMKPETIEDEDWNILDRQVLGVLINSVKRSYLINFVKISCTQFYERKDHSGFDKGFV